MRNVYFVTDYRPGADTPEATDTVRYRGIDVIYGPDHYIKPKALEEKCFIRPGHTYSATETERTYQALSQLGILRSINIEMVPAGSLGPDGILDAYICARKERELKLREGDAGLGRILGVAVVDESRHIARQTLVVDAEFGGKQRERRTFDLLDINYVYLPESTIDFINQIAPSNPLLRYSYEDHFIMRTGYTYYRTNRRIASATDSRRVTRQPIVYSLRAAGETAGNLLYAISSLSGQKRHDGVYRLFGIQYSQYAKAEFDYSIARNFADRHSLAFHVGAGISVPYGNSRVLPFEKRFYAGGANGVRGWGVRTLGPGSYDARNSVTDL